MLCCVCRVRRVVYAFVVFFRSVGRSFVHENVGKMPSQLRKESGKARRYCVMVFVL